uniref:Uncharacterized protein n=1 Tax=Tanacetum cinerariifolium TaxID=118510 RepID=A0A6L2KLW3_TANCI|nr:hypothetical protein [Tanacetum cinerariifolium]
MIVEQQVDDGADEVHDEGVPTAGIVAKGDVSAANDEVHTAVEESSIPSPTPPTSPSQPSQDIPSTSQDKDAQALEITKLKQRVKKLERWNKASKIKRLNKVDEDVVLEVAKDVIVEKYTDVDERSKPVKLQEVVDVVTTAKLITEVVTASIIRDPKETATPSTIVHSKSKFKDKGKWILVEEPKPLKKQAQIKQDEAYARELEAELNKNIELDKVIDHVHIKHKEDNAVKRYQALKRKLQTKAQARKNMTIYLKNVAGFKMDYFKGMTYDDIRLIFEKHFDSNVAFLQKTKEQMDEEDSRALKRINESQEDKAAKKQKLDEEVEELKRHLQIVPNDEDNLILLVERRYPLTRFTLDQMLNNVRLKVEEDSEVSLELLSFEVDAAEDFKENMLRVKGPITTQALEIDSFKKRVKKLEKKQRSRTHKLKRLYKVGLTSKVDSSEDEQNLDEDISKQGRIKAIDADEDITLVNDQDNAEMFDVNDLKGEEVFIDKELNDEVQNFIAEVVKDINNAKVIVDAAQVNVAGKVNAAI